MIFKSLWDRPVMKYLHMNVSGSSAAVPSKHCSQMADFSAK